jgi:hypothetical protein
MEFMQLVLDQPKNDGLRQAGEAVLEQRRFVLLPLKLSLTDY